MSDTRAFDQSTFSRDILLPLPLAGEGGGEGASEYAHPKAPIP